MQKIYNTEREGQIEFFENYGIPWKEDGGVLVNYTDGVWNGCLMEFKLNINDVNRTLFQAIKYLSKMRLKGESVPATIVLVSLNTKKAYVFESKEYFREIHTVYIGEASKNNDGFVGRPCKKVLSYDDIVDSNELKQLLKRKKEISELYVPIEIDENCIVGWGERFYRERPDATKGDFLGDADEHGQVRIIGEIREPKLFAGLILPYAGKTNEKFMYLMDQLNDRLRKKDLGAFYTPMPGAEKVCELVKMAVDKAKGDYVIIDRCAGTGALEQAIINVLGEEVASHIICSTYEYYEYKVLAERVGDKVRCLLPPTEADVKYDRGLIQNANAMELEFLENPIVRKYIDDETCTVILFENPPYHDESSGVSNGVAVRTGKKKDFVAEEMKKEVTGVATNETANRFIWSAFKYYLRQETDSYIVFSPVKYWKQYNFVDRKFEKGFAFNRKHFHATDSTVSCVLWSNQKGDDESIVLEAYDIKDGKTEYIKDLTVKKVHAPASKLYTKVEFSEEDKTGMVCDKSGMQTMDKKMRVKGYISDSVVGYLEADSFQIAPLKRNITRLALYDGNGCYLTRENFLQILPLWVAKHIPLSKWYEKDILCTTSDGGREYEKDKAFLKSCLIFACLSNQNKCLSFVATDGKLYRNELCFDNSATLHLPPSKSDLDMVPEALTKLNEIAAEENLELDDDEKELMELWNRILEEARSTKGYHSEYTYGTYQVSKELDTFQEIGDGRSKRKVYDHPTLNGNLATLRDKLKKYYMSHIADKMFQYELLK